MAGKYSYVSRSLVYSMRLLRRSRLKNSRMCKYLVYNVAYDDIGRVFLFYAV